MRITEQMIIRDIMKDIQSNLSEIGRVQHQIASGKRIQLASEDPVGAFKSIDLNFSLRSLEQFKKNADEAAAWINVTLSNLTQVRDVINQAKIEALRGGTDSMPRESRQAAAEVVDRLRERLFDISRNKWRGSFIFGGHKTSTEPFSALGVYQGDQGKLNRTIGPGETVVVNYDGQAVFQGGVDMFASLDSLKTALENNDTAAINATIDGFDAALNNILELEAIMGSEYERTQSAIVRLEDAGSTIKVLQAENDDVDLAQALVELQSMQNIYQAALSSGTQVLQNSLLRFLR